MLLSPDTMHLQFEMRTDMKGEVTKKGGQWRWSGRWLMDGTMLRWMVSGEMGLWVGSEWGNGTCWDVAFGSWEQELTGNITIPYLKANRLKSQMLLFFHCLEKPYFI